MTKTLKMDLPNCFSCMVVTQAKSVTFPWNPNDEWAIASVSEDNVLQIWSMAEEIYTPEEEDDGASEGADGLLGDDELEE